MRVALAGLAAVLSTMALALAFPPYSIRPLAYVGLVPLLLAMRSGGIARAVGIGWIFGVAYGWSIATVFPGSIAEYYERPAWFGVLGGTAIFTVTASLYYMAFGAVERLLSRLQLGRLAPFVTAAAWVGIEWGRVSLFTGTQFLIGNPWGVIGYTHSSGSLAQVASWTGVYGISFAIVAVNAGIADWLEARWNPDRSSSRRGRAALLACLPAVVLALLGAQALRNAPDLAETEGLIEVAVVQGDVAPSRRWRSEFYGQNLELYLDLTRRVIRAGSPSVVVWPESAMSFFLETEPLYQEAIARVLREGDAELLAGGPAQNGATRPPVFNSVFLVTPESGVTARYDKTLLMPFSEYFPFGSVALMRRFIEGARTFTPGVADQAPIETGMGRVGVLICNEAMLPGVALAQVRAGAEILVSPSNDAWINGKGFSEHMLAIVRLRAIEQRRYLVRASTSGPSAVIDPWGRITVRTAGQSRQMMRGGVRPEHVFTPYTQFGDAFAFGCVLVVAVTWGFATFATRRHV